MFNRGVSEPVVYRLAPALVVRLVGTAFVALALLLDRMFPRRREETAPVAEAAREPARTSA